LLAYFYQLLLHLFWLEGGCDVGSKAPVVFSH